MAGKGGLEPPKTGPKPAVLPLNDFPLIGDEATSGIATFPPYQVDALIV